jgi:hypothetical protein
MTPPGDNGVQGLPRDGNLSSRLGGWDLPAGQLITKVCQEIPFRAVRLGSVKLPLQSGEGCLEEIPFSF